MPDEICTIPLAMIIKTLNEWEREAIQTETVHNSVYPAKTWQVDFSDGTSLVMKAEYYYPVIVIIQNGRELRKFQCLITNDEGTIIFSKQKTTNGFVKFFTTQLVSYLERGATTVRFVTIY